MTAMGGHSVRSVVRRDAAHHKSRATTSDGRPKGRFSRLLGASTPLDDVPHRRRDAFCPKDAKRRSHVPSYCDRGYWGGGAGTASPAHRRPRGDTGGAPRATICGGRPRGPRRDRRSSVAGIGPSPGAPAIEGKARFTTWRTPSPIAVIRSPTSGPRRRPEATQRRPSGRFSRPLGGRGGAPRIRCRGDTPRWPPGGVGKACRWPRIACASPPAEETGKAIVGVQFS